MSHKDTNIYKRILTTLRDLAEARNIEDALIRAIRIVFPAVDVNGSNYAILAKQLIDGFKLMD